MTLYRGMTYICVGCAHDTIPKQQLQGLRDEYASLFSDVCTMKQFLWQDNLVSVAKFIHACLDKMFSCETGLSNDSQASDQPDVAGRDVT